jgi:ribosomal protein S15P/S13E
MAIENNDLNTHLKNHKLDHDNAQILEKIKNEF